MGWHRLHRADDTQADIMAALRRAGCLVCPTLDICDLLCLYRGRLSLLDCSGSTRNRKRTAEQLKKFALWGVVVVKTPLEALVAIGAL